MSDLRIFSEENLERDLRYCYNRILSGYKSITFSCLLTVIEELYYLGYVSEDLYTLSKELAVEIVYRRSVEEVPHE